MKWLLPLSIGATALVLYLLFTAAPFFPIDDALLILQNEAVTSGSLRGFWQLWSSYDPELYIPLTLSSYFLEYQLAGSSPWLYHVTNVVLHVGSSVLVWFLVYGLTRRTWVAALTALLFAVHPTQADAVMWVSARKDLLAGFFTLWSAVGYLQYRKTNQNTWLVVSLFSCLLALLSKVTALSIPLLLLLIDYWIDGPPNRKHVAAKWPWFLLSLVFLVVGLYGKVLSVHQLSLVETAYLTVVSMEQALVRTLLPTQLSITYPFNESLTLLNPGILFPVLILASLLLLAYASKPLTRVVFFGFCWWLFALTPHQGNFLPSQVGGIILGADRYSYVASIGIFFLLSAGAHMLFQKRRAVTGGLVALLLVCLCYQSSARASLWLEPTNVYRDAIAKHSGKDALHSSLGELYMRAQMYPEAEHLARQLVEAHPQDAIARTLLGEALLRQERYSEAESELRLAIEYGPQYIEAKNMLALGYLRSGHLAEAQAVLLLALEQADNTTSRYLYKRAVEMAQ